MSKVLARSVTAFVLLLSLSACNTLTREQCAATNWGGVGYDAANHGKKLTQTIEPRHRQCDVDYGVRPNFEAIKIGYEDGLKNFCSRDRAREFGEEGGSYRNTCPKEKEAEFLAGYQLGRIEYTGNRVNKLEGEVEDLRDQLHRRNSRINDLENEVQRLRK